MSEIESSVQLDQLKKRDGTIVPFDATRIENAICAAMNATGEGSSDDAKEIVKTIEDNLIKIKSRHKNFIPEVEGIQDQVEEELIHKNLAKVSKAYILYRNDRTEKRRKRLEKLLRIPDNVKKLFEDSKKYFKSDLNELVYMRTYARWLENEKRRECWIETVDRYMNFMRENLGNKLEESLYVRIREAVLNQEIMPSMRLLQFAGDAARRSNICVFNCAYDAPTCIKHLADIMFILMEGSGVGFSVESQNVHQFPQIKLQTPNIDPITGNKIPIPIHVIPDSSEGWCDAFKIGLEHWFDGKDIQFDYSQLRPAGARLKTKGGKSSGPEPLRELLEFARKIILNKQGKRLTSIELHDLLCYIGLIVVCGGVRRTAMISLSDLDDIAMREAKANPDWYIRHSYRSKANNSAVYDTKPSSEVLLSEWLSLIQSNSGERGIFNRGGLIDSLPARRIEFFRKLGLITYDCSTGKDKIVGFIGVNPCVEIILRSKQFCNLTEIIARLEDTEASLMEKMYLATILGTYQASLTNFPYIDPKWKENCDAEALLGVSITGQWDCPVVRNASVLQKLKSYCIEVNQEFASKFGINPATATTCVKPSGTVSQTVECSSGMHMRFAPYYIRRIRISATDDLFKLARDQGIPYHPEVGEDQDTARTYVLEFPVKCHQNETKFAKQATAIEQLNYWKLIKENYTEHNASCSIYVGENEWIGVLAWIYENWNIVGGISFFPKDESGTVYKLAPYEEITKEKYEELMKTMPKLDFSQLYIYEKQDNTNMKDQMACSGGQCEF